jgi:hypothetical protein
MCKSEFAGADAVCPNCKTVIKFPELEDFDKNKSFTWPRLILPIGLAWFLAFSQGLLEYEYYYVYSQLINALGYSLGALGLYALVAWFLSLLFTKLYRKLNYGKLIYKRRVFGFFLIAVAIIFIFLRAKNEQITHNQTPISILAALPFPWSSVITTQNLY